MWDFYNKNVLRRAEGLAKEIVYKKNLDFFFLSRPIFIFCSEVGEKKSFLVLKNLESLQNRM